MPDTRNTAFDNASPDYASLDIGQWAWEFLRRNAEYQTDYHEFISTWQALEADYGAPPQRDFPRWKADPRATRPAWNPQQTTGAACVAEAEERQMIECWMGAKWGFYQFPQNPQTPAWALETPIQWRPAPGLRMDRAPASGTELALTFDLSYPLPAQLEAAKQKLVSQLAGLRRQGQTLPHSASNQAARWLKYLHALDAQAGPGLAEAQAMSRSGYRDILRLQQET